MRTIGLKLALAVGGIAFSVLLLEVTLRLLPERTTPTIVEADPAIGTRYISNLDVEIPAEDGKGTVRFRTNENGFIGSSWRESRSELRIGNFGDSPSEIRLVFTEDVRNDAARRAVAETISTFTRETRADGARFALVAVPAHF